MKLSNYNYWYKSQNDDYFIWNTISGSIIKIDPNEYELLSSHQFGKMEDNIVENLKNNGVLISDEIDELRILEFDSLYFSFNNPIHIRILTTTACNAKCPYCYEKDLPSITMTKSTADQVVTFIKERILNTQGLSTDKIHIEWFGGEPLVNHSIISYICDKMSQNNLSFESTMASNAILFSERVVQEAKERWNLQRVQITLDGIFEDYNNAKGVLPGTFELVINNIKLLLANDIWVSIRINYFGQDNTVISLIHYISHEFLQQKERISIYIYPLFNACEEIPASIMENVIMLNRIIISEGLMNKEEIYYRRYRNTRCFATNLHGFTVAPDGLLYNCTHAMNKQESIGSIWKYSNYNTNKLLFLHTSFSEKCKSCFLLPICKGGCKAAELGKANMNQCIIYKSVIDLVLNELTYNATKEV